jgi:hypothetical protein
MKYQLIWRPFNWRHDPIMRRYIRQRNISFTMKALNDLFEMGLIAWCPGGRVKPTPAMKRESWRLYV